MAITTNSINGNNNSINGNNKLIQMKDVQEKTLKAKEKEEIQKTETKVSTETVSISVLALEKQREAKIMDNEKKEMKITKENYNSIKVSDAQREERLSQLKQQIENGTFKVDSRAIANKLISDTGELNNLFNQ